MTSCWETTVVKIKVIHMNTILVKSFKFQILNNDIKSNSVQVSTLYTILWMRGASLQLPSWQEGQKPTLRSLHWLPIYYRADFKVLLSTLKPFKGQDLAELLHACCSSKCQKWDSKPELIEPLQSLPISCVDGPSLCIRSTPNLGLSESLLKIHLFFEAFFSSWGCLFHWW